MVCFQSTPTYVGRSFWVCICRDGNCSRRATVGLGIDTLIANILVNIVFHSYMRTYNILFVKYYNAGKGSASARYTYDLANEK